MIHDQDDSATPSEGAAIDTFSVRLQAEGHWVFGGAAAEIWAWSVAISVGPTLDIDCAPHDSRVNLDRLSLARDELGANIRAVDAPIGFALSHDGESLGRSLVWNLIYPAGPFDLSFMPSSRRVTPTWPGEHESHSSKVGRRHLARSKTWCNHDAPPIDQRTS